MNLALNLSPEIEARLRELAARSGKAPESLALEALEEKLSAEGEATEIPFDEWAARFDEWLKSHRPRNANFDDSRESIYPDRG